MAVDFFLKLDTIEGESIDDKHQKWIQLLSWSIGGSQVTSVAGTGGSGAGKADLSDLSIMKYYDKASPKLWKAMIAGTHLPKGTLEAVKSGADGKPFLKIDFEELYITSVQQSASSEIPSESVSFSYNKIKIDYSTQDEKGILTSTGAVTYELKANKVS
jgi:type VI secretion system secreted protein Hcp